MTVYNVITTVTVIVSPFSPWTIRDVLMRTAALDSMWFYLWAFAALAWAVLQRILTPARTPRLGLCHNAFDTSTNTKAWAVSQCIWRQCEDPGLGCVTKHWHYCGRVLKKAVTHAILSPCGMQLSVRSCTCWLTPWVFRVRQQKATAPHKQPVFSFHLAVLLASRIRTVSIMDLDCWHQGYEHVSIRDMGC